MGEAAGPSCDVASLVTPGEAVPVIEECFRKVLEPNDFADVVEVARTLNAFERHWQARARTRSVCNERAPYL